jgi:hypothetical protein
VSLQKVGRDRDGHTERAQVHVASGSRLVAAGGMPTVEEVEKAK